MNNRIQQIQDMDLGLSEAECLTAVEIADGRYGGDLELGALWVVADYHDIITPDRNAWNDHYARARLEIRKKKQI